MKKLFLIIPMFFVFSQFTFAQRIACVDTKYILDNISEYRDAQSKLDALSVQWQKDIEAKFTEIDKLYKAFQAEAVLLPEDVKNKRQDEIINKEREAKELQKKYFGSEGDLFKRRQELVKPIQDKVYNAVEEFATEKNYAVIFDKAGGMTILYINARNDVSDDILKKLGYKPGAIHSSDDDDYDD